MSTPRKNKMIRIKSTNKYLYLKVLQITEKNGNLMLTKIFECNSLGKLFPADEKVLNHLISLYKKEKKIVKVVFQKKLLGGYLKSKMPK